MTSNFRPEIEGLRALAVLSVLFFHAKLPGFSGGFVGVDIFFVISGFLITRLIYNDVQADRFSFRQFYLKRLRRLGPSLLIVLAATWPLGWLFLGADAFSTLNTTLLSALGFASNWYFAQQTSYFDAALESNALLHTWSLSVEEQFYLFWPLLIVIVARVLGKDRRWWLMAVMAAVAWLSYQHSEALLQREADQVAFFSTLSRIWELAAGGITALLVERWQPGRRVGLWLRWIGLIILLQVIQVFSSSMSFPGQGALFPVMGTVLILIGCSGNQNRMWLLEIAPARFIGRISYSLYLWHWPLLAAAGWVWPQHSHTVSASILVISAVLATATTYLIENPIRFRQRLPSVRSLLIPSAAISAVLGVIALYSIQLNGLPERWDHQSVNSRSIRYDFGPAFDAGRCFVDDRHGAQPLIESDCLTPQRGKVNVLVIGDSFAAHLMAGLRAHFPNIHFNQGTASACRALLDFGQHADPSRPWPCPKVNQHIFREALSQHSYDAIILASDWQYYSATSHDGLSLQKTIHYVRQQTKAPIIVLGNSPVYKHDTELNLRIHHWTGFRITQPNEFREGLSAMDAYNRKELEAATFISLLDQFCNAESCPLVTESGDMVHFGIHLTQWGADAVIGSVADQLEAALPAPRLAKR